MKLAGRIYDAFWDVFPINVVQAGLFYIYITWGQHS